MARPSEFDKENVLEEAMRLFWQKGYPGASAQDVTEATGLSRSSLYNAFEDKRTLFIACLRHYISHQSKGLMDALSSLPQEPESIKKLLYHVVEDAMAQEKHPIGCLVVNTVAELGSSDPAIAEILLANVEEVTSGFYHFIQAMQDNGSSKSQVPALQLATLLFHEMTAIRLASKILKDRSFFHRGIEAYMQLIQH